MKALGRHPLPELYAASLEAPDDLDRVRQAVPATTVCAGGVAVGFSGRARSDHAVDGPDHGPPAVPPPESTPRAALPAQAQSATTAQWGPAPSTWRPL